MPNATAGHLVAVGTRHFVAIAGVLALACYVAVYTRPDARLPLRSDGYSYYVYLPSWLLYRDVTLDALARDWYGGTFPAFTAIVRWAGTGRWVNPHPIGTAILMAPWFAAGHALTRWSNLPPDGFSLYYQHAAGLAGLAYFLAGLAVLRRTLSRHFSNGVVLATLVTVTWGMNLFHYGVFDSTFSHVYSFFLICVFVELTERWWAAPTLACTWGLGLTAALVGLTRHANAIFLLILPLYGVTAWCDVRSRAVQPWLASRFSPSCHNFPGDQKNRPFCVLNSTPIRCGERNVNPMSKPLYGKISQDPVACPTPPRGVGLCCRCRAG